MCDDLAGVVKIVLGAAAGYVLGVGNCACCPNMSAVNLALQLISRFLNEGLRRFTPLLTGSRLDLAAEGSMLHSPVWWFEDGKHQVWVVD